MNLHEIYLAAQLAKNDIKSINVNLKEELAKKDEQTALNRSTLGYQRKNFLINNCTAATKSEVTATVNAFPEVLRLQAAILQEMHSCCM